MPTRFTGGQAASGTPGLWPESITGERGAMRAAARQLGTMAALAATETLRSPFFVAVLTAALVLAGVAPCLTYLAVHEKRRLVADSLLALTFTGGSFAAIVAAAGTVGGDLRRRSAALLLTKPVSRCAWFAGRVLGVGAVLSLFWFDLSCAALWGSRTAEVPGRWAFDAASALIYGLTLLAGLALSRGRAAGLVASLTLAMPLGLLAAALQTTPFGPGWRLMDFTLLPALARLLPGLWLAAGVGATAALWLDGSAALLAGAALFGLGLVSDGLLGHGALKVLWVVAPNWLVFWAAPDDGWAAAGRAAGYAGLYLAALVVFGAAALERRDAA
jgi:hypothetical protein